MSWIERILPSIKKNTKKNIPEGLWVKCDKCSSLIYKEELINLHYVCGKCGHHLRMSARERIACFLDIEANQLEIAKDIESDDPLSFKDQKKYKDRCNESQKNTGEKDALVAKQGMLKGMPVVVLAFEFKFMGGSMGSAVGEKFVRAVDVAIANKYPLICFSASGGARMQEGLFSLMQMSKTSLKIKLLADKKIPFISVLTDPTMGGVSASFAMLGDINIAEPKALIGFAGPRVVEQTVREELPENFQKAEFLLEKGALDMILHRSQMRNEISSILLALTNK